MRSLFHKDVNWKFHIPLLLFKSHSLLPNLCFVVTHFDWMVLEVTSNDIEEVITQLKSGKHDGAAGLHSDHFINRTDYLNLLCSFNIPYIVECLKVSTIISIPKDNGSSLIKSDNYLLMF